jgi:DNA modification methylase
VGADAVSEGGRVTARDINTPVKGHGLGGGTVVGSHNGEGVGAHRSLAGPVEYREFLEEKVKFDNAVGFDVEPQELNPALKDHTRAMVRWALKGGRRALFAAFGLHKTCAQLELMRLIGVHRPGIRLITVPLGVRQEFRLDTERFFAGSFSAPVKFIRRVEEVDDERTIYLTNYESVREGILDIGALKPVAVSLDEASILRGFGGTKTFRELMAIYAGDDRRDQAGPVSSEGVPFRFVATATPSPNEYIEILAYAAFLGIMDVGQAKTRFFKRNSEKADALTLHPHKKREFWLWVASWALFVQRPSDLGFSDDGYELPPLDVRWHELPSDHSTAGAEKDGQGRMFRSAAIGVQDAAREKRDSLDYRIARMMMIRAEDAGHRIIWHDLEDERRAIEEAIPTAYSVYGSQDLDEREQIIIDFSNGKIAELAGKPSMLGSGCNFQRHCAWAIFLGIGFKFNDFIQAIHRLQRFGQTKPVRVDLIYTEAEREVRRELERKWQQHVEQVAIMTAIIREFGLSNASMAHALTRTIGCERQEAKGEAWTLVNNDCVLETQAMESDSVGLIVTSIPFSHQYEYSPSYNDFGHTDNNEHFWRQMDFLTPHLLRVLQPGRVCAVHVKDRITPGGINGFGFQTVTRISDACADHFERHGFAFLARKTVVTDVVRENNQTYRLGWSEQCKDGSRMGAGLPEYIMLFRKPPTDRSNGYADLPVAKSKLTYTRPRWQYDAHGFTRSSGNRMLQPEDLDGLPQDAIYQQFRKYSLENVYDFKRDVALAEHVDRSGWLPSTFMLLPPASWHPDVWTDVARMRTLNSTQAQKGREMHLCPLQFDIVERLIEQFSMEGEEVYDPFAGLATVPFCAVKLGRRGRGCELATVYWKDGIWYLQQAEAQRATPSLFDLEEAA